MVTVLCGLVSGADAARSPFVATDLGTLGGAFREATAMNDHGQVVGESETSSGRSHAFSWTQAGGMVDSGRTSAVIKARRVR